MISDQAVSAAGTRTARAGDVAGLRTRWALLVSVAGGLALFASFPPIDAWPLAVLGPALLVVALAGRSLRGSFGCGLAFGLTLFVPLLSWLINVAWYGWFALAGAEAVIFAVLAVGQRLLLRLRYWPAAVAGWWVLVEGVRDRWPFAFPWGRLAMSQSVAPDVRWVAIGGVPLLTFLVALTGAMFARAVLSRGDDPPQTPPAVLPGGTHPPGPPLGRAARPPVPPRGGTSGPPRRRWPRWAWPAVAAVVTAGLVLAGGLLPVDPAGGAPTAQVAAIQGDVPHARNLPQQLNDTEVTQHHVNATLKLAAQVKAGRLAEPELIIWPENSTDLDPYQNPSIYNLLATTVNAAGRPILVGEVLQDPQRNVGQLWVPGRGPTTLYVKRQLVPFGEYIPFRGLISSFSSLPSLQPVDFTPGHLPVVFDVGKIRLGDVICYEVGFDNLVRSEVNAGANLLTVQSNDADFEIDGQLGETEQQTAMARIRAVESDRALVYASTTGESTIIAPDGALIAHSGVWQQAILDARVPLVSYRTLADRVGGWPEYVIIMLTVLALAWAGLVSLRARRRSALQVRALQVRGGSVSRPPGEVSATYYASRRARRAHAARAPTPARRRITVRGTDRRPARRYAIFAAAAAIGLLATGCSSAHAPSGQSQAQASASARAKTAALAADLKITPSDGSRNADPSAGIAVTALKGKVTNVTVRTSGDAVSGHLSDGGKTWHSTGHLDVSQGYTVTVTGTDPGGTTITKTSTFRTLTPSQTFSTEIYEGSGQTYGVGMPIMLIFSQPITNKAAVERSLELTTSKPVIGAWYWDGDEHLDFRPRDYWPAYTTVSFSARLNGLEGAKGVYAAANLTQTFSIGRSLIAVASTTTHHTQIYLNGTLTYQWPISTGRASLPTPDGTYVSVDKSNPVRMIGGGAPGSAGYYNELVNFAVRFTFSGDYYHSAPWSVVDQGVSDVSHGCVNLPPAAAQTYYDMSIPGDPITVTASTAAGRWDDGWTEWFLPWSQLLNGSALGLAVQAGPQGSTFVSASSLPADTATAPLETSATDNYYAGAANLGA